MIEIAHVYFFSNGNLAVTNADGQQVPELQESYLVTIAERLERAGFDPLQPIYHLPGSSGGARLFKTDNGWNWEMMP